MLDGKTILITGGTGSFGKKFTATILHKYKPRKVIIFSRDEFKQYMMEKEFPCPPWPIRYFIGDIRDQERLYRAFEGVDYVVHAAALKQVPAAEYNPFEAVKTNILGAQNIVNAALDRGVKKVVALSTDKAVSPVNLYGATKLAMEKLMIAANSYAGARETVLSVVRYGNVVGSRGSVIPIFLKMAADGATELPVTDERMTRFWITLEQGVELVLTALEESVGGEIFIPHIPTMSMNDLAKAILPRGKTRIIGIRPGEKIHESLVSEDEGRSTVRIEKNGKTIFIILPSYSWHKKAAEYFDTLPRVPEGFSYRSDNNDWRLTPEELKEMIKDVQPE
ncbi:MAG TPA: UDP-N-acetylglucosamine 4,6-dehydratase (inverting) [Candidatus Sumerlaeota bacterium]|nr:UDP-N-acetylglucosamine 4,6-dehydratase (inverting) [Candidatus Sumerlaeota bacterium]